MDRERHLVLAFMMTALCALVPTSRAHAQTDGGLDAVTVDVSAYPQVALTIDVPDGPGPSWSATVDENGTSRPAVVQAGAQGAIEVALAIDTSGSMAGAPLDAAKSSAVAFVQQLPAGARAAVIGFGNRPYVVSPMTGDRVALEMAIAGLRAGGETALYDAIGVAAAQFSLTDSPRSMVLVSDGGDTVSTSTLDEVTARLVGVKARLFALRVATRETNDGALQTLAAATNGRAVDGVDAASLASAYQQIAGSALRQVRLTYTSGAHGTTPVHLELVSGDVRRVATISVPLPASTTASTVTSRPLVQTQTTTPAAEPESGSSRLVLGGSALFIGLLTMGYRVLTRPPKSLLASNRRPARATSLHDLKGRFGAAMERSLEQRGRRDALGTRLENAGIALRPGEYLVLGASAAGVGFLAGLLIAGIVAAVVFAAFAALVFWLLLGVRTTKRKAALERQLPELLQQLTSSLRAGYGIMQTLDSVAREVDAPMSEELRRVVNEVQLGRPLSESLDTMASRVGGEDFGWVVQAIEINAEVGGDLVEVLDAVAETVRARASLRRQIKTLSAQGRLSARMLLAMPFAMAVLLSLVHPGYLSPLVETSFGPVLLGIGAVLMTVGSLWMRRIVRLRF